MDPISGLPGGGTEVPTTTWIGGYCTTDLAIPVGTPGACDFTAADDVDDGCGYCGQCVNAGENVAGVAVTLCLSSCTPAATTNPCRAGYTCSFELRGCMPACASDVACRVYREDTNHDGALERGVDRLVYDVESMATCNMTTGRCDHPSAPGAVAGIPCERDSHCEENGECRTEMASGWPGGYCTKRGCDVRGWECTGAGDVCQIVDGPLCLQGCTVGTEPIGDRLGAMGHGLGCRAGYACIWNGSDGATTNNGACIPGNYNDVTMNNVGAPCAAASATDDPDLQCYSPFGFGRCITPDRWGGTPALPTGMCTVLNCAAPGVAAADPCGPAGQCVSAGGTLTFCLASCASAAECPLGYACGEVSMTPTDPHACVPNCASGSDCTTDRRCVIPMGEMVGRCVLR